ncbi:hypothetical protein [Vibrio tasmaniensis]|uniref:hypothetical protein n=1 Tax=Vibrio tasmaniensis TaxID=212663 RepID=UPI00107F491D|nr:hypothetical protein [Vibrio tasmaniensis]
MYNLNVEEISMVDGGGDGGWQGVAQDFACTLAGAAVGGIVGIATRKPGWAWSAGTAASLACSAAGRSVSMSNIQGNAGFAGGRGL